MLSVKYFLFFFLIIIFFFILIILLFSFLVMSLMKHVFSPYFVVLLKDGRFLSGIGLVLYCWNLIYLFKKIQEFSCMLYFW